MLELRENEAKTLQAVAKLGRPSTVEQIVSETGMSHAAVARAAESLAQQQLLRLTERESVVYSLTAEGESYAKRGLPERQVVQYAIESGGSCRVEEAAAKCGIEEGLRPTIVGWIMKKGWGRVEKTAGGLLLQVDTSPRKSADELVLERIAKEHELRDQDLSQEETQSLEELRRRNLAERNKQSVRVMEVTDDGQQAITYGISVGRAITQLTPEIILSEKWRQLPLQRYNIKAAVAPTWPGKKQPYRKFLDDLKWKLVSLGFKEMVGPTIELMFFNCDALYMPQDHPAREIHDIYFVKSPQYGTIGPFRKFLSRVARAHENGWTTGSTGWGYKFSDRESLRLILRSQGTSMSARTLVSNDLEIPGKYYSISRCYRPDVVDKQHLPEFNQIEGIVVGSELTVRDLLGVLERFALDIAGADRVRFRPDYFPFTEPSVELSAFKEGYGWLEFGGSGLFRPEMLAPLGIDVPVIAWGLGVDRLFMMHAGIDDIRELFSRDLEWMRKMPVI